MDNLSVLQNCIDEASTRTNVKLFQDNTESPIWVWQRAKVHHEKSLVYIRINKNASQYFDFHLKDPWQIINVKEDNLDKIKNYDHFVTLRDPIDRWIAGTITYMLRESSESFDIPLLNEEIPTILHHLQDSNILRKIFLEYYISIAEVDIHTCSQLWFLSFFNLEKIIFFYMNDKLGYQINKFLQTYKIKNNFDNTKINTSPNIMLYYFFNEMLNNSANTKFLDKLKQIYRYDYEFLRNIKFYAR